MNILVVGSGGREHALVWTLGRNRSVSSVICAPGNAGISRIARTIPVDVSDIDALLDLAEREAVDLTVIGPELPLDRGVVDLFSSRGLKIFGPSAAAARLECSKVFAKDFMARHGIPTARYRVCENAAAARAVLERGELGYPVVVKADGLAAGKGVVIAADRADAEAAVTAAMDDRQFGAAGDRVVLEECMTGPEVSFFAMCDGERAIFLGTAQDHKRIFDNDEGPNTGGMGAFAPSPLVDEALTARIMREIVEPVVAGMKSDGHEYRGFLYAGLMLTCDGPKVIEFNVRFGDPEAQVVLPSLAGDLAPLLMAAAKGDLSGLRIDVSPEKYVGVVLASRGYPQSVPSGLPIAGLDRAAARPDVMVFHAGTAGAPDGPVVTAGGRVLTVVAHDATFEGAIDKAYGAVRDIEFDGMQYRSDIGQKALVSASRPSVADSPTRPTGSTRHEDHQGTQRN
jgi:phosphoribosylamine--glycine ligase